MAKELNQRWGERYLIFNVGELTYDIIPFRNQVVDHCFHSFSNPPLRSLFIICAEIKSWLDHNPSNIAVLQC